VFTGVSGSGKSSLVFGTIAAESQRMINETYSAFLQTFMGSPSRPDVDALHNLSAEGMCPACEGIGKVSSVDVDGLVDRDRSINQGAITVPYFSVDGWYVKGFAESGFFDPDKPLRDFTPQEWDDFLYRPATRIKVNGINTSYEGLVVKVQRTYLSKDREGVQPHIRAFIDRVATFAACPACGGTRLKPAVLQSRIEGRNIADCSAMQVSDLAEFLAGLDAPQVGPMLANLRHTLDSLVEIGLGYLSLDRESGTLSGGEAQRVKMVRHLGSSLTDITYVFDEPTVGLHPHDIQRMNGLLLRLRDKGNTVLVVEHKPETIAIADHVVDLGPGAGPAGGHLCFEGSVGALRRSDTLTGRHLDVHRAAGSDPDRVRQGEQGQGRAVQRQFRGRLPELQRHRTGVRRPGDDGGRGVGVRGVRGQAVHARGAHVPVAG
jgi:excinuclease UvrABC ATPase subunit